MTETTTATEKKKSGGNGQVPGIAFGQLLANKGEHVLGPNGSPLTLGAACELALDTTLKTDENEGLKPKLKRGRLIEQIGEAAKDMRPLALEVEDIKLLKDRIAGVFGQASLVRNICLLLDPASKE